MSSLLDVVIGYLQTWRCHLNPVCCSMMMPDNPNLDKDMDIVCVVRNVHGYINKCLSGISSIFQCSTSSETV